MSLPLTVLAATFGAASGAFVPRVAHRLAVPAGAPPRSSCCARPFPQGPSGWVRAGPACSCTRGTWRPILGSAAASGLLAATTGPVSWLPVLLLAAVVGTLLIAVDLRCLRLPDPVVAVLAAIVVVPLSLLDPDRVIPATLGAALSGVAYLLIAVLSRGGLGLGDVKLAVVLGFGLGFLGWPALLAGLIGPHLINGPVALFLLATGRAERGTALPLGPALLVGALLAVTAT